MEILESAETIQQQFRPGRLALETIATKRPWWVKTRSRPKYELDEAVYERFDPAHDAFSVLARERAAAAAASQNSTSTGPKKGTMRFGRVERAHEGKAGWELRDRALREGANTVRYGLSSRLYAWSRIQARSPEDFGVERHQGSLGENARLVKTAARFYGAVDVGVALLDRRHVYSHDENGRPILFEDVKAPIVDEDRRVIPERCRWVIVLAVPEAEEAIARAPDAISAAVVGMGYSVMALAAGSLAEFIR